MSGSKASMLYHWRIGLFGPPWFRVMRKAWGMYRAGEPIVCWDDVRDLCQRLEDAEQRGRDLELHAKDTRFLLAALIRKAGGRIELTMGEVIAIDANASIVTWDDVINDKKVYMLQTMTTTKKTTQSTSA